MSETEATPQAEPQAAPAQTPEAETVKGEPFDAARAMRTIEQLRAEIKELKPKARQAEELSAAEQKRKEAEMTEAQKLQAELEKVKAELRVKELESLRRSAAEKVELPLAFADRLKGETFDELVEDAKKLLEALPKAQKTQPPAVGATNPGAGASTGKTDAQHRAEFYGTGNSLLTSEFAKAHGGGVVWSEKKLTKE